MMIGEIINNKISNYLDAKILRLNSLFDYLLELIEFID